MTKMMKNTMYGEKNCATVTEVGTDYFMVTAEGVSIKAHKAFSCLVEPKVSDEVVIYRDDRHKLYITDILHRPEPSAIEILAKDGLHIKTADADLDLSSGQDIRLNASRALDAYAEKANVVVSKVRFLTRLVTFRSETLRVITTLYHGVIDDLHLKSKHVTRFVSGHEELQCDSSRKIVKESDIYSVKESITIAEGQVKIDAEQINMG